MLLLHKTTILRKQDTEDLLKRQIEEQDAKDIADGTLVVVDIRNGVLYTGGLILLAGASLYLLS